MTLNWPDIVDDNLQAAVAAKLVDIELVSQLHFAHTVIRPEGGIDIKAIPSSSGPPPTGSTMTFK